MNEAVDRLIAERQRMDAGLPATVLLSIVGHLVVLGAVVALPMLLPRQPLLRVAELGFTVVAIPRGGGGSPTPAGPPAQAAPKPEPVKPAAPPPAPKVLKPPTEAPRPNALPTLDSRRLARKAPEPAAVPGATGSAAAKAAAATGGVAGGRGTGTATPGLEIGPPGVGVPDGTEAGGDWYIAGVTAEDLDAVEPDDQDRLRAADRRHVHHHAGRQRHERPPHAAERRLPPRFGGAAGRAERRAVRSFPERP